MNASLTSINLLIIIPNKTNFVTTEKKLYGLVVCGGNSTRMGRDKSTLIYYDKQQRYHLYEILENICDKVFISCNSTQANDIGKEYQKLIDLPGYENTGPMAALLTSFEKYPDNNFLAVGCDYPLISENDLKEFLKSLKEKTIAAAFYNREEKLYEPLLAWYSFESAPLLKKQFRNKQYSLQYFLKTIDAVKHYTGDSKIISRIIKSVDTPEEFLKAKVMTSSDRL